MPNRGCRPTSLECGAVTPLSFFLFFIGMRPFDAAFAFLSLPSELAVKKKKAASNRRTPKLARRLSFFENLVGLSKPMGILLGKL
jgi:hypothetical protein